VLPVVAVLLLVALACGGQHGGHHSKLELLLAQGDRGTCGKSCKYSHATAATCGTLVGAHRFYRCRVDYDNGGGSEPVCAALDGSEALNRSPVIFRPLSTCKR
jgi:hypothetical protein